MEKQTNKIQIVWVIVFLFIFSILLYLGYIKYQPQQKAIQPVDKQIEKNKTDTTTSASEADSWKTYINKEYAYSLKYPSGWYLDDSNPQSAFLTVGDTTDKNSSTGDEEFQRPISAEPKDPKKYARIMMSDTGISQNSVLETAAQWRIGTVVTTTIAGQEAARVLQEPHPDSDALVEGAYSVSFFVKNVQGNILLFELETANITKYEPVFNQILSTLTFQP